MNKIALLSIITTFSFIFLLVNVYATIESNEKKKTKKESESDEKNKDFSFGKDYVKELRKQSAVSDIYDIIEDYYIPEDRPLDKEKAEFMYCWYPEIGTQESAMRMLALYERMLEEFDEEEIERYQTYQCENYN